jgi:ABC-type transport system involved in multi-copper enzyme maturation permease subunit
MIAFQLVYAIALNTFREAIRAKLLIVILLLSLSLLGIVTLFGMVTIGDQIKVLKDFGLATMSLTTVGFGAIAGATLLDKELQRKTVYNILSKSVHRWQFLVGKFFGLYFTMITVAAIVALVVALAAYILGAQEIWRLLIALLYVSLEGALVAACVLFFSTIVVTPSLTGLFTVAVFIAGRSSGYLLALAEKSGDVGVTKEILTTLYWLLPNFALLNIADYITFGAPVSIAYTGKCLLYSFSYATVLLFLSTIIFEKRDLQ